MINEKAQYEVFKCKINEIIYLHVYYYLYILRFYLFFIVRVFLTISLSTYELYKNSTVIPLCEKSSSTLIYCMRYCKSYFLTTQSSMKCSLKSVKMSPIRGHLRLTFLSAYCGICPWLTVYILFVIAWPCNTCQL